MNFFSVVKFKRFSSLVVMVAAAVLSGPVASQPHGPSHHHGGYGPSSKHHGKWPQATLQAQARTEVAHDTVNIVLAAEISDDTQEAVAQALTQAVSTATDRALDNAAEGVKVRSGNFRVWPMNDKDGNISNWRGRGEIFLESTDFAAASELASSLADLMAVASIRFSVSAQLRAQEEQKLLEQAAQAFRNRAQALADAMGYADYTLRSIDVGGAGVHYETAARGFAAAPMMQADSIPLEGGTETVSVSIQGSVFLRGEKAISGQR